MREDDNGRLMRLVLRLVPVTWRTSVSRDLTEEADAAGRRGVARDVWLAWQMLRIALRLVPRRARRRAAASSRWRAMNLASDVRLAVRAIRHSPWSTAATVATLAIGIGVTTTVYAIFNYALFRPVPGVGDPDALVTIHVQARERPGPASWAGATDAHLRAMRSQPAFAGLAAYQAADEPFQDAPNADVVSQRVTWVTAGYFDLLRVQPLVGRFFSADEYARPDAALAVISERLWRSRFGANPDIGGHVVHIRDRPFVIIGVARTFRGLDRIGEDDVWIPFEASTAIEALGKFPHGVMVGRLAPGVSLDVARAQATAAFDAAGPMIMADPSGGPDARLHYGPALTSGPGTEFRLNETEERRLFWISTAGVALLFLLACANAANQLIARNTRQRRELAMKSALGATPLRALRELIVEAGIVSAAAGALGLAFAALLTTIFRTDRIIPYLPPLDDLSIDWRVVAYALMAAAVTVFVAAGLPSIFAVRAVPRSAVGLFMVETHRRGRTRATLVGLQIALSVSLLSAAGALEETLIRLEHVPLGFNPDHVLTMKLEPHAMIEDYSAKVLFFRAVQAQLVATPGIEHATFDFLGPIPAPGVAEIARAGQSAAVRRRVVCDDTYFETLQIPVIRGRTFTAAEARQSASVVVLDQGAARELFGSDSPVGRSITVLGLGGGAPRSATVIGVVGDTMTGYRDGPQSIVYELGTASFATFEVRSSLSTSAAAAAMRQAVRAVEPSFPRPDVTTLREDIDALLSTERLLAKVGALAALFALGIGAAGVYAVVACTVAERTREFGVRLALGAPPAAIGVGVMRSTLTVAAAGAIAGLVLYAWAWRWIASSLYDVSRFDMPTLGSAVALVLLCALAAAFVPARRAMRVDPAVTLRAE